MYGTVKLGPDDFMWSCAFCSALVADKELHDEWHRRLADHGHSILSTIGGAPPISGDSVFRSGGQTYDTPPRPDISVPTAFPRTHIPDHGWRDGIYGVVGCRGCGDWSFTGNEAYEQHIRA